MSFTLREDIRLGDQNEHLYLIEYVPPVSYVTAGEAVDPTGNTALKRVWGNAGGYILEFVPSTQKVKIMYGDNNNAADGPLIEIPAATDLSATTFYGCAIGE